MKNLFSSEARKRPKLPLNYRESRVWVVVYIVMVELQELSYSALILESTRVCVADNAAHTVQGRLYLSTADAKTTAAQR